MLLHLVVLQQRLHSCSKFMSKIKIDFSQVEFDPFLMSDMTMHFVSFPTICQL